MIKLVYTRNPGMKKRTINKLARKLYSSNCKAFVNTKEDPFDYLRKLEQYGIYAIAKPVIREKRLIGYQFKNAV